MHAHAMTLAAQLDTLDAALHATGRALHASDSQALEQASAHLHHAMLAFAQRCARLPRADWTAALRQRAQSLLAQLAQQRSALARLRFATQARAAALLPQTRTADAVVYSIPA